MISYLKRWLGEILVDIGTKLMMSSTNDYVRYARKQQSRNKYYW